VTAQQAGQLVGPYIALLITALGVPLTVAAFRWLGARAAAIQNQTVRDMAMTAVRAVEQTLTQAPSPAKKAAAVSILTGAGVPVDVASTTVEAAVHALHDAATQVLTTAPATVTVQAPPVPAAPVIAVPEGTATTLPH
jgi:predicted Fe-Mo cluster-binding NifX family protein